MKPEMGVSNEGNDKTKHLEYLRKIFIKTVVNSAYQKRWCKIKARVLEGMVNESLKEGKIKTSQFFLQFLQYAFSLLNLYGHHVKHSMLCIQRSCV
jgi:hypothetical protein